MKYVFSLIFLVIGLQANAQSFEFAGAVGPRFNSAETDLAGAKVSSKTSYQAGVLAWFPLQGIFGARSGFMFNQRFVTLSPTLSGTVGIEFSYFDVPLTPAIHLGQLAWIYAGPILAFNQSKDVTCSLQVACFATDVKSFLFPFQLGVDFKFGAQMGAEFYYEYVAGELAKNVSDMKSVGANFLVYFE